jgi:hypothetical protein
MKIKVVLKNVGAGENGAKTQASQEYSPTCPRTKLQNKRL